MTETLVCPYCMDEKRGDELGCCGESRGHFVMAVEVDGELVLVSELSIEMACE